MTDYLYRVTSKIEEYDLCQLEREALFGQAFEQKVFMSQKRIDPSVSAYIKKRLEIYFSGQSFDAVLSYLEEASLAAEDFFVSYISFVDGDPFIKEGKKMSKEIGLRISGYPSFEAPKVVFGLAYYEDKWYFGKYIENSGTWKDHQSKPYSYSSSIGINIAKALVNIGSGGDKLVRMIDPCCGVGTVLLEAAYAGYTIEGRELNKKVAQSAQKNIEHFGYSVPISQGDIQDIVDHYDVAIVDLPYNNFTLSDDEDQWMLIRNAKRISDKMILISSKDIKARLLEEGVEIHKSCKIYKKVNRTFARYVWVCT
jgi:predicted RNA methylase